jgi:hypothetical protein
VRKTDSEYVTNNEAWYVTTGYRVGKFTPYVSYAKRTTTSNTQYAAPSTVGWPGATGPTARALVAALDGAIQDNSVSTLAVGGRWDLGKSYALKAELAQVKAPAGSAPANLFRDYRSGLQAFRDETNTSVFSVLVDFVF